MQQRGRVALLQLLLLGCGALLLLLPQRNCLPTVNEGGAQQANSYARQLESAFFQPPHLEDTIEEVQKILANDPTLPRLTRGEIEELYEKVTREEYVKSVEAGDMGRADSMRALMLVLPYNTDNNTEENLQELYTRPPVTRVIDSYTPPQPIKFVTADPSAPPKAEGASIGKLAATTYKPSYALRTEQVAPSPTTYHPAAPPPPPPPHVPQTMPQFQPITSPSVAFAYGAGGERAQTPKPAHRFSSHYSAKNAEFLRLPAGAHRRPPSTATATTITTTGERTVKPVADVLESLGIVGQAQLQTQSRNRYADDDYYAAESVVQPVVSGYVPQKLNVAELSRWRGQSLSPKIKPDAYSNFKPLNIGEEIRAKPEVEDYLTRFGIVGGRKRKALKKNETTRNGNGNGNGDEPASEESEISTAKLPTAKTKSKKSAPNGGGGGGVGSSELDKLLENLQELERLNVNPKTIRATTTTTTKTTTTTTRRPKTTSTTTTTTSTTTMAPITMASLITNGTPLLIEAKKPRRRIDPNFDINYGAAGNHQSEPTNTDQLAKLLENLQELEKLRANPDKTLKATASRPTTTMTPRTTTTTTTTARPAATRPVSSAERAQSLTNRFSELGLLQQLQRQQQAPPPTDTEQLQRVLKELQALERHNARTTARPTAATSTRGPTTHAGTLPGDLFQLQKLLGDDRELERLYEQARAKKYPASTAPPPPPPPPTTTSILTTTTTTTKQPVVNYEELKQLQKYLASFDRVRTTSSTSTSTSTTTTTTTTPAPTSTSSTTSKAALSSATDFAQRTGAGVDGGDSSQKPKKSASAVDNEQLQELISRVQQLERVNSLKSEPTKSERATESALPFLGFTSRNVNAAQTGAIVDATNDFAQLQQLYRRVQQAEQASFGRVEISTAATASKQPAIWQQSAPSAPSAANARRTQDFAQRLIDITNDTGSGSSLQAVDANDFVQLQKLLSKVQELDRVKINVDGSVQSLAGGGGYNSKSKTLRAATVAPSLVTSASLHSSTVQSLNGAHIVYPEKHREQFDDDDLKLDLPVYRVSSTTTPLPRTRPHSQKMAGAGAGTAIAAEPTSSEELRNVAYDDAASSSSAGQEAERDRYRQFGSGLGDDERERDAYQNMQPPVIQKTATREPPRFVATHKPNDPAGKQRKTSQQADLAELQKLLSNAQELEKLGITLPKELSAQIETKLIATSTAEAESFRKMQSPLAVKTPAVEPQVIVYAEAVDQPPKQFTSTTSTTKMESSTSGEELDDDKQKTVVFSLTTMKSLTPKPKATPKPASENTIELPVFSATKIIEDAIKRAASKIGVSTQNPYGFRRRSDADVYEEDDDMMGEFSELNYQLAMPAESLIASTERPPAAPAALGENGTDISMNVSELQRLISNLQELKNLNVSISEEQLRAADVKYLDSFKRITDPSAAIDDDAAQKSRRQSATSTPTSLAASETSVSVAASTTMAPTRINLDLATAEDDDSDIAVSSSSTTTARTEAASSTTEEPRNGSFADLEDSFGPDPNKEEEEPLPPKKKNGFYFLADWNSFLEVGVDDDQVIVRLSPKIGDPRLFIPVKIP